MDAAWLSTTLLQSLVVAFVLLALCAGIAGLGTLSNRRGWKAVETACARVGIGVFVLLILTVLVFVGCLLLLAFGALVGWLGAAYAW